ncbi:MAG: DUF58 domain-containing protein [Rhizomicrobium sp.]
MIYPTRTAIVITALGVPLALVLGMLAPGWWLWGVAWLFLAAGLAFADALLAGSRHALRIESSLPEIAMMGRPANASFSLRFAGRFAPQDFEAVLDANARLAVSPVRQTLSVLGREAIATFQLEPLRRGEAVLESLWIRWRGPLGLIWKQRRDSLAAAIPVVTNVAAVKDEAMLLFERGSLGLHVQLHAGAGAEFHALTEFQPGMDRRSMDWKQSARHGILLAKEYQAEQNQHVVIALDTGRLMSEPLLGQPRLDRALQAALLLAFVGLKLGDRVGFFAFDEKPKFASGTLMGSAAFPQLQRLAASLDYSTAETNFTLGLTQLAGELEHRSIVVVFTDFSDTTSAELMLENVARLLRRHLVLFVVFRDEELESMIRKEPVSPEDVTRAVIADSLLREKEVVVSRLQRLGVDIVDVPADQIGAGLVGAYLSVKHRHRV